MHKTPITFEVFDYELKQLEELNNSYFVRRHLFDETSNIERTLRFLIRGAYNEFLKPRKSLSANMSLVLEMQDAIVNAVKEKNLSHFNGEQFLDEAFPSVGVTTKRRFLQKLLVDGVLMNLKRGCYTVNMFHPLFASNETKNESETKNE